MELKVYQDESGAGWITSEASNGNSGGSGSSGTVDVIQNSQILPFISDISPLNNSVFFYKNIYFNFSIQTFVSEIKNVSLYINNTIIETKELSGYTNNSYFNRDLLLGEHTWMIEVCEEAHLCSNTSIYNINSFK